MKLINDDRAAILRKATEATFSAREALLKEQGEALGLDVRNIQMTAAQQKAVDSLPSNFFEPLRSYSYFYAKWHEEEGTSNTVQVRPSNDVNVPDFMRGKYVLIEDRALWDDLVAWRTATKDLAAERAEFEDQTRGVLAAFTTVEKLLDHWPTLKVLMGEAFFVNPAKVTNLPTATINALDAKLQAERPFETEIQAAAA